MPLQGLQPRFHRQAQQSHRQLEVEQRVVAVVGQVVVDRVVVDRVVVRALVEYPPEELLQAAVLRRAVLAVPQEEEG